MSEKKITNQKTAAKQEAENAIEILNEKLKKNNEELNAQNEKLKAQNEELTKNAENFLRIVADYENKMKRAQIDAQNLSKSMISNLVKDLVPILEDLNNATTIAPNETKEGLSLIEKNAKKTLKKYGIEEIIPKIGDDFNPEEHQAITSKESQLEEGKIVEVIKIGYKYGDRTITPTIVIVSA